MDVEDENLLSTLFKDSFPESFRNNSDFYRYLSELSSFGLERLNSEPEQLAEEKSQILTDTQQLAFQNYGAFIETAKCSKDVFQDFQIIEKRVDNILEKIPKLNESCSEFINSAKDITLKRKKVGIALQKHTQLLEILEVPQLLDTCVRNSYYDEALELISYVRRLNKKFTNIAIIENIVKEVAVCSQLMLNQLIDQLRSNIQLPVCLKIIGYLRRMDVFDEAELRMKYLHSKDAWFNSVIILIPNDDVYVYLNKVIDSSRVNLFDIVTQYRAIFSDDQLTTTNKKSNPAVLLQEWIVLKIDNFLNILKTNLNRDAAFSRIESLLAQCMYFGLSFSRVGIDFRPLVAIIFRDIMHDKFIGLLNEADTQFAYDMQRLTLVLPPSSSITATIQSLQYNPNYPESLNLLYYPPLTTYLNNILTALNCIGNCNISNLAVAFKNRLESSLIKACNEINDYHNAEVETMNDVEKERFALLCKSFNEELLPHVAKCFGQVFPAITIANILGLGISQINRMMLANLDCKKIEGLISNPKC